MTTELQWDKLKRDESLTFSQGLSSPAEDEILAVSPFTR